MIITVVHVPNHKTNIGVLGRDTHQIFLLQGENDQEALETTSVIFWDTNFIKFLKMIGSILSQSTEWWEAVKNKMLTMQS